MSECLQTHVIHLSVVAIRETRGKTPGFLSMRVSMRALTNDSKTTRSVYRQFEAVTFVGFSMVL